MSLFDAIRGAKLSLGKVEGPSFPNCNLSQKGNLFMISGLQCQTYLFEKKDISSLKVVAFGNDWVKYKMTFSDGKIALIQTSSSMHNNRSIISLPPFERFFGDLL